MSLFPGPTARAANVTDSADDCVEVSSYESASINLVFKINEETLSIALGEGKPGLAAFSPTSIPGG